MLKNCQPVTYGILLGVLTLIIAEFMASSFGMYEKDIKAALFQEALEHTKGVVVKGHEDESDLPNVVFKDRKEAKKVAAKAWEYLKRAHFHGEGMGVIAIALCLVIAHTLLKDIFKKLLSIMIGLGALGYPFSWFYAGTYMVDKGKHAAKAEIHPLAVSSVSLYLGGLILIFCLLLLSHWCKDNKLKRFFFNE